MDDLLHEFLTETNEGLELVDRELVNLEQNPNDKALLSSIFRIVHTIKGTCGFIGLPRLEKVAHAGENILGKFRDGELEVIPAAVTLILKAIDQIKYLLATIEATGAEPEGNDIELIAHLNRWASGDFSDESSESAVHAGSEDMDEAAIVAAMIADEPAPVPAHEIKADFQEVKLKPGEREATLDELEAAFAAAPGPAEFATITATAPLEIKSEPAKALVPVTPTAIQTPVAAPASSIADQSIRVGVDVLEQLMNTVSELVLTRNQLLQLLRSQKDSEFGTPLQRLNLVTSELQESVMKTRMQPIGNAWQKLPRIVRDLANELGKKIDLQMVGQETELDRQVLELIKDPLTHMVRNSADHGLEMPADRVAVGKPEMGIINLSAFHEGGHIIIKISDDGKGLGLERIKRKAVENGLATEAEIGAMTDGQIYQFIFKAGFSTAAAVTSVSGRGVGMDVVRTNIEKIGGTIDLASTDGKGSTFTIKIPLTLAIVNALIVECATEKFAIPQLSVVELVRAKPGSDLQIERLNDAPVLRLRNRLLPLISLRHLLKLDAFVETEGKSEDNTFVIVTQVGTSTFGIMVDRVFDMEEIVVKPVASLLRSIALFSGNTILGDGSVIMILDPTGIAAAAGEGLSIGESERAQDNSGEIRTSQDSIPLLLFRAGSDVPKAVPLSLIARLEEIDLSTVEHTGERPVVQYRGQLMPLICVDGKSQPLAKEGLQPVLVFSDKGHTMGLVVDEILDITEQKLHVELGGDSPGIMGSAIVSGRATEVIDTGYYLTLAFKDWFNVMADGAFESEAHQRVLLVDDSPFFRNLLAPLLAVAGFEVTAAESPKAALQLADSGSMFELIVSDIEMPEMSGFEFAEHVRASGPWQTVPMIALSSHATPKDLDRGLKVGFTDYVAKFDREALLHTIQRLMQRSPH